MKPNDTTKKPRKQKPASKTVDEPGKRYWLAFGQIHFVKKVGDQPARRTQIRLAEYLTTTTLDHVHEVTEAIKARFTGKIAERVEIWTLKEMSRQKWEAKQRTKEPRQMVAVITYQPELFPTESLASARPDTLCPIPGAKPQAEATSATAGVVKGRVVVQMPRLGECSHSKPQCSKCFAEMVAKDLGVNAPEAIRNRCAQGNHFWSEPDDRGVRACAFCEAIGTDLVATGPILTKSEVPAICAHDNCEREGILKGSNGLYYCPQCFADYPDEKPAKEPVALITRDDLPGATA